MSIWKQLPSQSFYNKQLSWIVFLILGLTEECDNEGTGGENRSASKTHTQDSEQNDEYQFPVVKESCGDVRLAKT